LKPLNTVDQDHPGEPFNPNDLIHGSNEELNADFTFEEIKKLIKKTKKW